MQPACRVSSHGSLIVHRTSGRCKLPRYRSRSRPAAREPEPPFSPLASLTAPNQYRRDLGCLSRRPTEASRWNRAPVTGHSINNSGGRPKKKRKASKRRQLGLSEESTQHTRTHRKVLREQPTRRPTAPYSNCAKEEVLQGFRRRAAWTGMSQLTAAIRHAFPSSCATRNAAPHFPFGPRKAHRRAAGQVETSLLAHRRRYSPQKLQRRGAHTETEKAHENNPAKKNADKCPADTETSVY